jgi:DNA-binding beta-propeller fold protein YncE
MKIYFLDNKIIGANIIDYSSEKLPYYPASNIRTSSTKSRWRTDGIQSMGEWISFDLASPKTMEYFQALGANLGDACFCYVEGADDSGFSSGLVSQYISGKDLKAGKFLTQMSKRYFRLRIIDGVCFVGTSGESTICYDACVVGNKIYTVSNHRVSIFSADDFSFINSFGSQGSEDGKFNVPTSICSDGTYLYVADRDNYRIQKFTLAGDFVTKKGENGSGQNQFNKPVNIRYYNGNLYIADRDNNRVQVHQASDLNYVDTFPTGIVMMGCWIDETNQYLIAAGYYVIKVYKLSDKGFVRQSSSLPEGRSPVLIDNYLYRGDYNGHKILRYNYSDFSSAGEYIPGSGSLPGQLKNPSHLNFWPERNLILVANIGFPYYVVGITPDLKFVSNPDGYIEIGKLTAAEKKSFARHVVTQFASKQDDKSLVIETENLVVFSVRKDLLKHVAFTLQQLTTADKQMLEAFISEYGLTRSFAVYIESESEGNYTLPNMKFSGMPQIETIAYNNYSVKIDLVEEV